ncbi:AraC-like DNA-binding protein [Paenibacillus cellulosilyticus]|uniref:AraC-like DNA-binding protein n=1 Tax=Paenibacillus cellulosilyticus TaxID=375489 RepID=A0A2V2YWF2_9BACL|nr:helix-turn-helix domain-containing protein [Paenibacillus cellulosilyticus]PWW05086.1 AraC-like DNA-binding protein [Paenibacillus cellulosilyticus]QKS48638.1 AraC family transcriptional regulator [Paenibacillus cellulosilyticus]
MLKWDDENIRCVFNSVERTLPLYIETIGYSAWERIFVRPDGYPCYHWLHTLEGEGSFEMAQERFSLTAGKGVLLTPFTPHSYYPVSDRWSTVYITFGGTAAGAILDALDMNTSAKYTEVSEQLSFSNVIGEMLLKADQDVEFSGLESSTELYHFLMLLRKYSMRGDQPSLSQYYEKLRPVVQWMENNCSANVGLPEIVDQAHMSVSYLNELFRDAFGMSPYSYLIQLRIRKAKKIMVTNPGMALKEVSILAGFNDVSHFVATFRKKEGMTPAKYRELHLSAPLE